MGRGTANLAHRQGDANLPARRDRGRGALSSLPGIVDAHAHVQHERFDGDRDAVVERARTAGIGRILVPGWDVASSEAALELAARHPDILDAAVGIHPHDASAAGEADWARLESLAAEPACVAIGEIGLDFYRNLSPPDVQRQAFARQLALAAQTHRPVVVHDREAHVEVAKALLAWSGPGRPVRGMLHAFSGDAPMAERLAGVGFLISFALPVTFRSAHGPRAAAVVLSLESILTETDSPFLGPAADRRNEPTTALRVATELAKLRGTTVEAIAASVAGAYGRLVGR